MKWIKETRSIKDLKAHPKNPRSLNKDQEAQLQTSLEKFGLCEPIVVNSDNIIIGGHQRVRTLKKMGHKEVDVYVPEHPLDEKQVEELNIRLNKNTGEWDFDVLANQWEVDDLLEWGFTESELQYDVETIESSEGEDEEQPPPPPEPKTKLGDVYDLIGSNGIKHRLICGDSTNPETVEKLLQGKEPILMVTDPPYGVNYDASWRKDLNKGVTATGKVHNDDECNWALAWFLFPGSVAYIWHASWFCSEVQKSLEENDFKMISQIIWVKQHFAFSRGDYLWQHEPCWYAVRKGHNHNWQGSRKETTIWEIANLCAFGKSQDEDERTNHSTQKPIDCMLKPILNNTKKGEDVYDPFLGSGTTIIACEKSNRNGYGVELDPGYCDIIVQRWANFRKKNNQEAKILCNGEEYYG